MGRNSIGVSGFALEVSRAIRSQLGIRRMSGRDLAKAIGRGPTYVRDRINDDKEWALGDLERICKLWNLSPRQLIDGAPRLHEESPAGDGGARDTSPKSVSSSSESNASVDVLYREARGTEPIDIDAWADRIKAEDRVHEPR